VRVNALQEVADNSATAARRRDAPGESIGARSKVAGDSVLRSGRANVDALGKHAAQPHASAASPFLTVGAGVGFVYGIEAGITLNEGTVYGYLGVSHGVVPGVSGHAMGGAVVPNAGSTSANVITGSSFGISGGYGVGATASANNSGHMIGAGATTPGIEANATYGFRLMSEAEASTTTFGTP